MCPILYFLFSRTPIKCLLDIDIIPWIPKVLLLIFSVVYFLSFSDWIISIDLPSCLLNIFSYTISIMLLSQHSENFIFDTVFFNFRLWSCFIFIAFLSCRFLITHFFFNMTSTVYDQFSQLSSVVYDSLRPHGLQHARPPCPSPTLRAYSSWCPLNWRCHPTISSSVIPFSSRLQSFPASGSFPISRFFTSGGQSIRVSASASALPMNIQDWFPLGWTGCISLLSKGLSRVFYNTTVQKHQFFST